MNVLLINGSPNLKGCTYTALREIEKTLNGCDISTELYHIGKGDIRGCTGCGACAKTQQCIFNDSVNELINRLESFDGLIVGSPVYYASPNGALLSFLDRLFYAGGRFLSHKPASSIVSARRAGTTASLDVINKYFTINQMPLVSGQYWNMVHGSKPEDVLQDEEGIQNMRVIGRNMAWLLKSIEAGKNAGIPLPEREKRARTNFIR